MTFGTIVLAQLRYLVSNLQKKNAKASVAEIESLLQLYGDAAVGWLLTILLQEIDFKTSQQKDAFKVALLAQEFPRLTARPNAGTLVCEVFQAAFPAGSGALSEETLHGVAKAAKASLAQQLAVGLGLARSHDSAVSMEGIKFLKTKLSELGSGAGGGGAGGGQKEGVGSLPAELVHALLFFLDRSDGFSRQRAALVKLLQAAHPEERCPLALLPLLWTADRETGDLDCRLSFEKERARARRRARLVDGRPRLLVLRHCKVLRRGPRAVRGARRGRGRSGRRDDGAHRRLGTRPPRPPAFPPPARLPGSPLSPHAPRRARPPPHAALSPPPPPLPPRSSTTRSRCTAPSRPPSPNATSSSTRSSMPTARETRSRRAPRPPRPPPPLTPTPSRLLHLAPPIPPLTPHLPPSPTPQALTSWNVDAFVDAIASRAPSLDWASVVTDHLDQPDLDAAPAEGLALIVAVYRKATRQPLPSSALLGEWRHAGSQLALLTHALGGGADVAWDGGRAIANPPEGSLKPELACWLNLDLTAALLRLSSKGHASACQLLFNEPAQAVPRLMLVALLQVTPHIEAPPPPASPPPRTSLPPPCSAPPRPSPLRWRPPAPPPRPPSSATSSSSFSRCSSPPIRRAPPPSSRGSGSSSRRRWCARWRSSTSRSRRVSCASSTCARSSARWRRSSPPTPPRASPSTSRRWRSGRSSSTSRSGSRRASRRRSRRTRSSRAATTTSARRSSRSKRRPTPRSTC